MQSIISNLKHQSLLTIVLAALAGYAANYIWYYIPAVASIAYSGAQASGTIPFPVIVWYFVNPLLNTIGIAALLDKKGAQYGLIVGLIITVFFNMTAYFAYYVGISQLPPVGLTAVTFIGSALFYALPATILAHMRKG